MHANATSLKRLVAIVALAAASLFALPASSMAAETFGSRLINDPNSGACNMLVAPCTYVSFIHPSDPNGDPYAGGAPNDGVITKFRIRAYGAGGVGTPASVTFRVADISRTDPSSAQAAAVGTGPTVTIAGTGQIEEFPGRLPVKKGNHLAIDTSEANAVYASSGSDFTYVYTPVLADGAPARTSDAVTEELLVAATVEPDADGDGFGDETQDRCVGQAGSQDGCPTGGGGGGGGADLTKPRVSGVSLAPRAFKTSAQLRYRLSEAAKVALRVDRVKKGRKVAGKCKRQTPANAKRKACKRYVRLAGRIVADGAAGLNQQTLKARLAGRKLSPGRYRLVMTARDGAGNVSAVKRIAFRIKR